MSETSAWEAIMKITSDGVDIVVNDRFAQLIKALLEKKAEIDQHRSAGVQIDYGPYQVKCRVVPPWTTHKVNQERNDQ